MLSGTNCVDFLFVFSEKRSLSISIHMYLNEFHLTSAERSDEGCENQRGAGARLSPERSKATPKHRRSGAGQLGGPGTGDAWRPPGSRDPPAEGQKVPWVPAPEPRCLQGAGP